jgi:hypothetical protein
MSVAVINITTVGAVLGQPRIWCGRWDSNPHDVAIEGF